MVSVESSHDNFTLQNHIKQQAALKRRVARVTKDDTERHRKTLNFVLVDDIEVRVHCVGLGDCRVGEQQAGETEARTAEVRA